MTGQKAVHILATGTSNDSITDSAHAIGRSGYSVSNEILMQAKHSRPSLISANRTKATSTSGLEGTFRTNRLRHSLHQI